MIVERCFMKIYLFILVAIISININIHGFESSDAFKNHKNRSYYFKNYGVKNLFFEIRVEGMIEEVKKSTSISIIDDLYFRVYWIGPSTFKYVVYGLPEGFKQLKESLKNKVKPFIDIVFNDSLHKVLIRGKFVKKDLKSKTYVLKNTERSTFDVEVSLNSKGILKEIMSKSTGVKKTSNFFYSIKSWSKGKYVLDKIKRITYTRKREYIEKILMTRKVIDGIGFPQAISIENERAFEKKVVKLGTMNLSLSNYNLNTKIPKKVIFGK